MTQSSSTPRLNAILPESGDHAGETSLLEVSLADALPSAFTT